MKRPEVRCAVCLGLFLPDDRMLAHVCDGCGDMAIVHHGLCDTLLHQSATHSIAGHDPT